MTEHVDDPGKLITGYCDPWSTRAGESVVLRASSHQGGSAELALVRISCGDPTKAGPGFAEEVVVSNLPATVDLSEQPLIPGSYGTVDLAGLAATTKIGFELAVFATRPHEPQTLLRLETADGHTVLTLVLAKARAVVRVADVEHVLRQRPLATHRWYHISCTLDLATGAVTTAVSTQPSPSPGRDLFEQDSATTTTTLDDAQLSAAGFGGGQLALGRLVFAGSDDGALGKGTEDPSLLDALVSEGRITATEAEIVHPQGGLAGDSGGDLRGDFDGRIGEPRLTIDGDELLWHLHEDMHTRRIIDSGDLGRHGELHQLPARGVPGPSWDGSEQRWRDAPEQWNAVHFHKDDLYDAGWTETATVALPDDLPSGIYAFRLLACDQADRVPFFVRPAVGAPTKDVALLMSSATYLAYANHRMLAEGAEIIGTRARLRPEHEYVLQHPELGRSMYEKHPDGSGVMFSSRLRPVLNLRPGADGWNFTPDTDINAFLEQTGVGHDVISDEDLHADGLAALAPYRVIVTCSHPEYWSTAMLDALTAWQRGGGRLMYLGGNGFYWRVAFSDAWPGAMELRRAEDGVRNWQTGDGENYHAFGGEYGGLWRRNGRPPNEIAGIGFAAQGFGRATYFEVNEDTLDTGTTHSGGDHASRASWIWDGVEPDDGKIGTSGLGGGAAGQEVDRYDTRLGSPAHAVVLASATEFGPDMVRTKEEFEGTTDVALPDPLVRADIVFYETVGGGAVFSVGSISWFGALARNGYDNDVAKMTSNVLHRFVDPAPFDQP